MAGRAQGNDSAVETSVGGLKLRKERSVLMKKERLFISPRLVTVEYEFLNTTTITIVSEVAFPIPTFRFDYSDAAGDRDFSVFNAWVDGKPIKVAKEVRAFVKDREVTADLQRAGITIERFGNFDPGDTNNQIFNLKPEVRKQLVEIGALKAPSSEDDPPDYWPAWEAQVNYHWTQDFPPHTVVHIKHEYVPVPGFHPVQLQDISQELGPACIGPGTLADISRLVAAKMKREPLSNNYFGAKWVSYILTTANSWQTPIKDFELIAQGEEDNLVSFCWDGPMEQLEHSRLRVHKTDFVPGEELKVYFLSDF